jgi:hypothetical protein
MAARGQKQPSRPGGINARSRQAARVETPADQPGGGQEMVAGWRSARDARGSIAGPPSTVAIMAAATAMIAPAKSARLRM